MSLHPVLLATLLSAGLLAAACAPATGPAPPVLPAPAQERGEAFPGSGSQPLGDTSVPNAATVFAPAPTGDTAAPATTGARDTSALSKPEAAVAMPQGGQANDHSAPLPADAGSSARRP
jgi:hypothetical protein